MLFQSREQVVLAAIMKVLAPRELAAMLDGKDTVAAHAAAQAAEAVHEATRSVAKRAMQEARDSLYAMWWAALQHLAGAAAPPPLAQGGLPPGALALALGAPQPPGLPLLGAAFAPPLGALPAAAVFAPQQQQQQQQQKQQQQQQQPQQQQPWAPLRWTPDLERRLVELADAYTGRRDWEAIAKALDLGPRFGGALRTRYTLLKDKAKRAAAKAAK
jgi:hypothetical protein